MQAVLQGAWILSKAKGDGGAIEGIHYLRRYLEYLFNQLSCKEK
jgi:hypothetical protein